MNRYLTWVLSLFVLVCTHQVWGQSSPNTVKFQVTYNAQNQTYTAWVVPDYSTPNSNSYNTGLNELVSTAQFTLKVPVGFQIQNITDATSAQTWDKTPVKYGQGLSLTLTNGSVITQDYGAGALDPNVAYYVIGKSPTESNLGSFTANTPVALFTFKGNGCFGPIAPITNSDPFIQAALDTYGYNVPNNFNSASGQPTGGNQIPLEQFVDIIGGPANCLLPIVAIPDINVTNINTPVSGNVLTNDVNTAGTPLTASLLSPPVNGTVTLTPTGNYTYTPPTGFTGTVSFCYSISNTSGQSSSACVSINVLPLPTLANDAPVANNDATQTQAGKPVTVAVLANDSDPDNPATPEGQLANPTILSQPSAGTAIVNNDGTVTYTPPAGLTGVVTFPYQVCDKATPALCATALVTVLIQPASVTGTSLAPVAVDDAILTNVNTPKTATVAGNDSDPNTPALSLTFASGQPLHGSVVLSANGSYTYTPAMGYAGPDSFTYTACNTAGLCSKATVYIDVQALPATQPPIATPDIANTNINTPVPGNVLTNDRDPQGLPLTVSLLSQPTNGTVTLSPDGSYTYTPPTGFTGTTSFCYSVSNSAGQSSSACVTVNVNPLPTLGNDKPIANNDAAETLSGKPVTIAVLANDTDPDSATGLNGQLANPTLLGQPSAGTAVVNTDGTVTYTPPAGFTGVVNFPYSVCDKGTPALCATAVVTVTVLPTPPAGTTLAPVAVDDAILTNVNTPKTATVAINDYDLNTPALSLSYAGGQPSHGSVVLSASGSYTYTPATGYVGPDSFTYTVCNTAGLCDKATVSVLIEAPALNLPPVVTPDINTFIPGIATNGNVLTNDKDPEGTPLTASVVGTPPAGFTLSPDGSYTYSAPVSQTAPVTVVYQACDTSTPRACATTTLTLTPVKPQTPGNDAPIALNDASRTESGVPVKIPVLGNDRDPEGLPLSNPTLIGQPAVGTAVVNVDGTVTYTPPAGFTGIVSFPYQVCDTGTPVACATAIVTVDVTAPAGLTNHAPVAIDDHSLTDKNVTLAATVAGNDTDPDAGQTLVFTKLTEPANGTVTFSPTGSYTFVPATNFVGTTNFTYKVCDNGTPVLCTTATAYITVTDPCAVQLAAPMITPMSATVCANGRLVLTAIGEANATFTWTGSSLTAAVTSETLLLTNLAAGVYQYTVVQTVNSCTSAAASTSVLSTSAACTYQPPIATPDIANTNINTPVGGNVLTNDRDPQGLPLTASLLSQPTNGTVTLSPDGSYTYTPPTGFTGTTSFCYSVSNSAGQSSSACVTVNVNPLPTLGNDKPIANNDAAETLSGKPVIIAVLANDTDPDSATGLNGQLANPTLLGQPTTGTAVVNGDGTVTYTPPAGFTGVVSFPYSVCDKGTPALCATAVVTVTVLPMPPAGTTLAPIAVDDAILTNVNTPKTATVAANDYDLNTPALSLSYAGGQPSHGSVVLSTNGSYTYTPVTGYVGPDSFTYTVCNTAGLCDKATVSVLIEANPATQPPIATPDIANTNINTPVGGNVLTNDRDPQGLPLTASLISQPVNGTVTLSPDGSYTYTPPTGFTGTTSFCYSVSNSAGQSSSACVTVNVNPLPTLGNDKPIANNDAAETLSGKPVIIAVLANDTDPDSATGLNGQLANPTLLGQPATGTAIVNGDGTVTYTPPAGFTGVVSFPYSVCDKGTPALCATAVVTVTVLPTPPAGTTLAPVAVDDAILTNVNTPKTATVAANDYDLNSPALSLSYAGGQPSHGSVVLSANGSYTYTPATGYVGPDSFTYTVCNTAGLCDKATVSVLIEANPATQPPIATPDIANTNINTPVGGNVLTNDRDPQGLPLTASLLSQPVNGTVTLSPDGSYTYTPPTGFTGTTSFCYSVSNSAGQSSSACVTVNVNPLPTLGNDKPIANNDAAETLSGKPVIIAVLANDTDPDSATGLNGQLANPTLLGQPATGTAVVNTDGTVTYTPPAGFTGVVNFPYSVCDKGTPALCATAVVTVTVLPTPPAGTTLAPVAVDDAILTSVNTPKTATVAANDYDLNTPALSLSYAGGQPSHGSVVLSANGSYTYTPVTGYVGPDSFTYTVCNTAGLCDKATVSVLIEANPATQPPVIVGEPVVTDKGKPATVCMPIIDGDKPDSFTASICGQPAGGTATVSVNNSTREVCLTYTPNATFTGPTTACVQVCDSYGNCTQTIVPITVMPESTTQATPQPPVVVVIPVVTPKDSTAQVCMPVKDPNVGDTHSVTICGNPGKGSVTAVVNNTTHEVCITYKPNPGQTGNDSFCLNVCDQTGLCTQVQVPVTIVDPVSPGPGVEPPVVVPPSIVTRPDEPVIVCTGITDSLTDSHTATVCGAPGLGSAQVGVNNTTHVLCVTYTPGSLPGSTSMCVQVCDQTGQCTQVIIPITILPPACTLVAPTAQPSSATICNTAGLTLTATGATGAVFTWTGPGLTAATGSSVTVLPAVSGLLSYTVTQTLNGCTSPPRVATVLSTSAVCLKAPVVTAQALTTEKNKPVTDCRPILDTPGDTHTVTICSQPLHGTLNAAVNNVTHQVCYTYTPATDFVGEDQLCLIVCDQTGLCDTVRVPITVVDPIDPPTGKPQIVVTPVTLPKSTSTTVCMPVLKVTPTDQLTATICGAPSKGTATVAIVNGQLCVTYNNTTGIPGSDTVCVTVCDQLNRCTSAIVPITITDTQKPSEPILTNAPIVVKPGQTKQVCLPYKDAETGTHTALMCSAPNKGTATVNAIELPKQVCVSYTPNPGVNSTTDEICVVLCNNRTNLCDTVRVPVTILGNPAKTPLALDDINTTPLNQPVSGNVLTNDDGYGLPLTASLLGQPSSGTVTLSSNGSYTYTPPTGFTGTVTFPYRACNTPVSCVTALVTIKVLPPVNPDVNNKPIASNDNAKTNLNQPVTIDVKANDRDPDPAGTLNGTLADLPEKLTNPANGTAILNTVTGKFVYTPAPGFIGQDAFLYRICDKGTPVLCDTALVKISVLATNPGDTEPPYAIDDVVLTTANSPVSGNLSSNDSDPQGLTLTYSTTPVSAPAHGQVTINADGTFSYTPVSGYTGSDQFVYQVCNSANICSQATAYIIVQPNSTTGCITVRVKVLLEGPYNALTGKMNTTLNQQGLLPGQRPANTSFGVATPAGQPYNTAPWNYTGTEGMPVSFTYASTVVDWVLVSLRTNEQSPAAIWRAAGLLHEDGTITFVQPCFNLPTGNYYVVIEHRNHVGVMSPQKVPVTNNNISFDFTVQDSYIVLDPPSFGQIQIGNKWLMYAADGKKNTFNDNFDINSKDSQLWQSQSGQFLQYLYGDFNMDADVNAEDSVLWKKNNGRYSRVPH